jgi:simple sugar transport system permease protein
VGGEGQLYVGALGILFAAKLFGGVESAWLGLPLTIAGAALLGGLWGGLAGALKAYRGNHEVITTILLNFIGINLVNYFIFYPFRNNDTQSPESFGLPESFRFGTFENLAKGMGISFFDGTPANFAFLVAVAAAVLLHVFLFRTRVGFEMRVVGTNPVASRFFGISVAKMTVLAMGLSGALAGMASLNDIAGYHYRVIESFSPGYGFTGIAVALLARNRPLLIPLSALLFGAFQNASRDLEFFSNVISKELTFVIQALLISGAAVAPYFQERLRRKKHA